MSFHSNQGVIDLEQVVPLTDLPWLPEVMAVRTFSTNYLNTFAFVKNPLLEIAMTGFCMEILDNKKQVKRSAD
jgi:hypothetical protein